jgi:hypothetical protein
MFRDQDSGESRVRGLMLAAQSVRLKGAPSIVRLSRASLEYMRNALAVTMLRST